MLGGACILWSEKVSSPTFFFALELMMLKKIFKDCWTVLFQFFEEWSLFIAVCAALLTAMANVVLRKTTDNYSLYWSDEVVRKVIYFSTYIGCVAAIRSRSLIRIDALPQIFTLSHQNRLCPGFSSGCSSFCGDHDLSRLGDDHDDVSGRVRQDSDAAFAGVAVLCGSTADGRNDDVQEL